MTEITLEGKVVQGLRAAGRITLAAQRHCFEEAFPEMRNWLHWATINLELTVPLRIDNFDFETRCAWEGPGVEPERFGFLRIGIEFPVGAPRRPALIYVPHNSPHFSNHSLIEVMTSKIEGINYGAHCLIHIGRANLVIV